MNTAIGAGVTNFKLGVSSYPDVVAKRWKIKLGLAQLATNIIDKFGMKITGGKVVRNVDGTNTPSKHSFGDAVDMVGTSEKMQAAANYAAGKPGVTEVIFNKRAWTPGRGWHKFTPANGKTDASSLHTNHVHIGGMFDNKMIPMDIFASSEDESTASGMRDNLTNPDIGSIGAMDVFNGWERKVAKIVAIGFYPILIAVALLSLTIAFKPKTDIINVISKIAKVARR